MGFLISTGIGFCVSIFVYYILRRTDIIDSTIAKSFIVIAIMFVFLFIAHCFMDFMEANREIEEIEEKIYSIGLEQESFTLGQQHLEYIYYTGDSVSGFKLESIPASKVLIKYTKDKPYIIKKQYKQSCDCIVIEDAIIYLPHNSIIQTYQISLQNK